MGRRERPQTTMDPLPDAKLDFAAEFRTHYRALWLVAMSVVAHAPDADDVMQEAAIIGMRKQGEFTPGSSYRAWMGEIVRNVALNRRRSVRRERRRLGRTADASEAQVLAPMREPSPVNSSGGVRADQTSLDDEVVRGLNALDHVARACLLLRCVEGLEYSSISDLLGIPQGTAMSHVFRSRKLLASRLDHLAQGATPPAQPRGDVGGKWGGASSEAPRS